MYLVDFAGTLFDTAAYEHRKGDPALFLYPDGATFLREKENSVLIVTAMDKERDSEFVQNTLSGIPRMSVMYTNGKLKGEYLAPYISMYGQAPVFVDDSVDHLVSMALHCPNVQLFEMRRDGREGDGRWPVVHTLGELP